MKIIKYKWYKAQSNGWDDVFFSKQNKMIEIIDEKKCHLHTALYYGWITEQRHFQIKYYEIHTRITPHLLDNYCAFMYTFLQK